MNRSERRKYKKMGLPTPKEPVFNLKQKDIDEIRSDALKEAFVLMLAIPVKVMHDEFGWGMKSRLPKLGEAIIEEYERFDNGDMTIEEYQDLVFQYCGMKFQTKEQEV